MIIMMMMYTDTYISIYLYVVIATEPLEGVNFIAFDTNNDDDDDNVNYIQIHIHTYVYKYTNVHVYVSYGALGGSKFHRI
jgi:hypothetical protein